MTPPHRPTPRVPGFRASRPAADVAPQSAIDPRAGTRQLNVRVLTPLLERHKRLIRELDDTGFRTNLTEVVQAVLHQVPADPAEVRAAVRVWRRALDPDM